MNSTLWVTVTCPCVINLWLWWDFTVFPTTVTDPSLALWMTPYRISSFRAEVRMLYENEEKSQHNTERRIYYSDDTLRFSSPRQQILHIRLGWRLTFPSPWWQILHIHFGWRFTVRHHSEREQKKNLHSILLRRSPKPVSSVRLRRPPPYK